MLKIENNILHTCMSGNNRCHVVIPTVRFVYEKRVGNDLTGFQVQCNDAIGTFDYWDPVLKKTDSAQCEKDLQTILKKIERYHKK